MHPLKRNLIVFSLIFTCTHIVQAQVYDTTYQNRIQKYTTDARFLPSSVNKIIEHPEIPSPLDHFGAIIGAPGVMHRTAEIYGYFEKLADSSPKLTMEQIGTSEEGRPIHLIAISSNATLSNIQSYQDKLSQLADPRKTDAATAQKLISEAKPIYYLNGGMHSPEMGSPEMLMELAYRLITDPSPEIQNILENTIILINPVSEPDGRDKQVDWYYRYSKNREEWDDGFRRTPPYWGKYVFHDNNRDGLQISQEISKAIYKVYFEWHPSIMLDLHESVPLLYISTGTGPYNEGVDPITVGEWQTIANHEMTSLAAQGLPGVFNWAFYDGWWPGYGIWVANTHNSIGRFYETFGNAGANTYLRDITEAKFAGDLVTSREWYRPDPATGKVYWSARNNTNYMQAGVLASLTYAADNGKTLLENFYQKGLNNLKTGEKKGVKMFTIPTKQRDPAMSAYLVNQLQRQQIEVHRVKSGEYEGEYVIMLDQPYSKLAYDLLTEQKYPKEAKFPPYDAIAWTLGYLYGVDVQKVDTLKFEKDELELLSERVSYSGKVSGEGSDYAIHYQGQSSVISALYDAQSRYKKMQAYVMDTATVIAQDTVRAGTIILKNLTANQARELAQKHGIDLLADQQNLENSHQIKLPRLAIYHSWFDTQAEGWVRFTLEQKGIPYTSIDKDDLKAGNLRSKFDLIIIPHMRGNAVDLINGLDDSFGAMPFTKTTEYPSHGSPDATSDMTGGPGYLGIGNLSKFVKEGGVLVPLENAAISIADLGIGKQVNSFNAGELFHPGSVVTVKARNKLSPILYGYPETFHIFKGNGRLLRTDKYNRDLMVLQYGTQPLKDEKEYKGEIMGMPKTNQEQAEKAEDQEAAADPKEDSTEKKTPYVRSGMVKNEKAIIGHGAIFNVPHGKGHVISFTFNPLHRYLNHHDASLLWNVLINWNYLDN